MHPVVLEPGSQLAQAMGTTQAESSSHHHQAIAQLARDLLPVARAEDGLVEAMELENGWVIGVQWHPEDTASADPAQQGLFDALVQQATQRAPRRRAASQAVEVH
jgi:putative glutamine amidotransferase